MDQNIIQIYHIKDIKLFGEDLIDLVLKTGGCIEKTKGHDLALKMTVSDTKGYFLLIILLKAYLIISISKI